MPAFPTVRVVQDVGETDEAEEPGPGAGTVADVAPVVVRGRPGGDGFRAVLLADADHLAGDQLEGLFPADALVRRFAPVLRVAPAGAGGARSTLRVEVHALHRVHDAVLRVDPCPLGERERGHAGLALRRVLLAVRLDDPRRRVGLVKDERTHFGDLTALDVDPDRAPAGAVHKGLLPHLVTPCGRNRCVVTCDWTRVLRRSELRSAAPPRSWRTRAGTCTRRGRTWRSGSRRRRCPCPRTG